MRRGVVEPIQPGPKTGIEIIQAVDLFEVDLTQELIAHRAMPFFQFALAFVMDWSP